MAVTADLCHATITTASDPLSPQHPHPVPPPPPPLSSMSLPVCRYYADSPYLVHEELGVINITTRWTVALLQPCSPLPSPSSQSCTTPLPLGHLTSLSVCRYERQFVSSGRPHTSPVHHPSPQLPVKPLLPHVSACLSAGVLWAIPHLCSVLRRSPVLLGGWPLW